MAKTVLKEIIITLLLCIAILLILSVIFYDYNPLNKIVPGKIAYSTPEDIKSEIEESQVNDILENTFDVVYSIDGSDLNIYKKSNSYVAGKANPFSTIPEDTTTEVTDNGQTVVKGNTTSNNATTTITNTNPDSTGTFLNNTGKK